MSETMIRKAVENDWAAIAAIEAVCFPPAEAASPEMLQKRLSIFPECFFVACVGRQIVGFVNGAVTDSIILEDDFYANPHLHNPAGAYQTVFGLDVLPGYQGRGIGSLLLKRLVAAARESGRKGVLLTCKDQKIPFYEKLGFSLQGPSSSEHGGAKWNDMALFFK